MSILPERQILHYFEAEAEGVQILQKKGVLKMSMEFYASDGYDNLEDAMGILNGNKDINNDDCELTFEVDYKQLSNDTIQIIKKQRDEISEYLSLLEEMSRLDQILTQTVCKNLFKMSVSDQIQVLKIKITENKLSALLYEKYNFDIEDKQDDKQ